MPQDAQHALDKTEQATEQYFNMMQKAFYTYTLDPAELADKIKSFTEENIAAA